MKRAGIPVLLLFLLLFSFPAYGEEPTVAAQGAALIDGETGRLLWGRNEDTPMAMASTTKIMTALLVLEKGNLEDVVTISKNAARQPEVHMDLKEGEQWRLGDLLSAMMLRSYNDAAVALAEHISGSVEAFCVQMTERARELGAKDTVFGSPNGLDSQLTEEQHHSTAYDMALLAACALKNEEFRRIISQGEISVCDISGKGQRSVTNADRFLREYEGAIGVKTGYTNKAGNCFVGAAERDDVRLVSAVLGSGWGSRGKEQKWKDTKALMNYGFEEYTLFEAAREGTDFGEIAVKNAPVERIGMVLGASYEALFSEEERERLRFSAVLPKELEAPVGAGDEIGRARLWLGKELLAELPLLAKEGAPVYTFRERLAWILERWLCFR